MTLENFINTYDTRSSVVLLEGKRGVANDDVQKLIDLGTLLAQRTKNILFRSGNAPGADQYFSEGVCKIDRTRLQVITPYSGHRANNNLAYDTVPLNEINLLEEPEIIYYSKANKKTEKLVDHYVSGNKKSSAIKAAYIIRDTVKVLGSKELPPAMAGIFYDDLTNPRTGGTGHTMDVCEKMGVPVLDQSVWFPWLEQ